MARCPVCQAINGACGHQPLRYPPIDLSRAARLTKTAEEQAAVDERRRRRLEHAEQRRWLRGE